MSPPRAIPALTYTSDPRADFEAVQRAIYGLQALVAADRASSVVNVLAYAAGDGVTDDAPAFTAAMRVALDNGMQSVFVPATPKGYRLASGITLPGMMTLWGNMHGGGAGVGGTVLIFDRNVPVCVTLDGGEGNATQCLRYLNVYRAGGMPPIRSVGVLIRSAYNVVVEDVMSDNHGIPWRWHANGVTGLSTMVNRIYSCSAADVHVEIDGWPELRFNQCRFGRNGTGDYECHAYVRIRGGEDNPAAHAGIGPNSIKFVNCQFNQGKFLADYWVAFDDMKGGGYTASIFSFHDCHVEAAHRGIGSTAGTPLIYNLIVSNVTFNVSGDLFVLDPATGVSQVSITGCSLLGGLTLAPSIDGGINAVKIVGNTIIGPTHLTGEPGCNADLIGNSYSGGLTLDGVWRGLNVIGGIVGGPLIDNATGRYSVQMPPTATMVSDDYVRTADFVLRGKTAGDHGINLTTDSGAVVPRNIIGMRPKGSAMMRIQIVAHRIGGAAGHPGDAAGWSADLLATRGEAADTIAIVGGGLSAAPPLWCSPSLAGVTASTLPDNENRGLLVQGFGVAGVELHWTCQVAMVEATG